MLLEELCQYYRIFVPIPVWFRYLISYGEFGNVTTWSLGILLALLYLILKVSNTNFGKVTAILIPGFTLLLSCLKIYLHITN